MELSVAIPLFVISALLVAVVGTYLTKTADQLADLTGLGEAIFGAVFLGGVTSLPGIVTSVVAAYNGHPELAVSNAIGGIAAQTLFLSIADITYRKTNLEHAAASITSLMQGVLLVGLLAFVLLGMTGPELLVFHIHPASFLIIGGYIVGSKMIAKAKDWPMWSPRITRATVSDLPDKENIKLNLKSVILKFALSAIVVGIAGFTIAKTGIAIAANTGLSESIVGVLFTAVATSFPELIVSVSAVKRGALTLSISNIIGGNSFDVLFIAFADMAYFNGSILHAITQSQVFIMAMTMLMTSVLIMGLLYREKEGFGKIGWESLAIIIIYFTGNIILFFYT
ncbi:cation:H+ antiporter [Tangfeifania diversioriginum]|uniref:Cation:H+ antiporter n=1 Tax=Tangfeifania diversioriginum TaxID=1168035 RepID=A0A1M6MUK7_9BACT|nr:sodium:calcium antiporter [Tangfeifania diversioriginum]SHJ87137.1 cation:H+ antiporter [Tangfeifania diversioriginum]